MQWLLCISGVPRISDNLKLNLHIICRYMYMKYSSSWYWLVNQAVLYGKYAAYLKYVERGRSCRLIFIQKLWSELSVFFYFTHVCGQRYTDLHLSSFHSFSRECFSSSSTSKRSTVPYVLLVAHTVRLGERRFSP